MLDSPPPEDVYEAVDRVWDFSEQFPKIRPGTVQCGHCGGGLLVRSWKYHRRRGASVTPYRCDVSTKCVGCSAVLTFGVVVPDDIWSVRAEDFEGRSIRRTQAVDRGWITR